MSLWGFQDRNTAGWWWWCCLYWGLNTIDLFHGSAICPFWSPRFSASLLCKKYSYWSCSRFRLFPSLYRPLKIMMLIFRSKHHGSFHGSNFSHFWSPRFSASFLCQKYSYWSCSSTFRFFPSLCRPFTNFLDLCCSTIYCATLICETPTKWSSSVMSLKCQPIIMTESLLLIPEILTETEDTDFNNAAG